MIAIISSILGKIGMILLGLFILGVIIPMLAVTVRRLHDMDKSGWWILLGFTGIGALVLLYWYVQRGTTGPNQFGEDPLPQAIAAA